MSGETITIILLVWLGLGILRHAFPRGFEAVLGGLRAVSTGLIYLSGFALVLMVSTLVLVFLAGAYG